MNEGDISNTTLVAPAQQPLLRKVGRGTLWLTAAKITNICLGLIRIVILARLLDPSDFGLIGIALLATGVLERFSESGFERALIQKERDIKEFLDTAWLVSAARGIVLFVVLFFCAPLIAAFYESAEANIILKVIAVCFLFRGFNNVGVVYFRKELVFRKQFIYQLSETVAVIGVSVSLAFVLRNVWALVAGMLAGNLVRLIVSYIIHPYRPGFYFSLKKAGELFRFGKWIYVASILVFIFTSGGNALVGKVLGVAALGFYMMAYKFSNMPTAEIAHVVSQATFPAYSKIQAEPERVRGAYSRVLQVVTLVSLPLAGGIFILCMPFIKIFLSDKWLPMIGALRLLCVAGALRSIVNTYGSVFAGIGRPEIVTKITTINVVVMALTIYPLTVRFKIAGAALSMVIALFVSTFYGACSIHRVLNFGYLKFGRTILFPVVGVVLFGLSALFIQSLQAYEINILSFSTLVVSSVVVYAGSVLILDRLFRYDVIGLCSLLLRGIGLKQ